MSPIIQQLLTRQFEQATESFVNANLASEWQQLQQHLLPQLQQLALSSDYAWRMLRQFATEFWQM
jgi:hypothetical protein